MSCFGEANLLRYGGCVNSEDIIYAQLDELGGRDPLETISTTKAAETTFTLDAPNLVKVCSSGTSLTW